VPFERIAKPAPKGAAGALWDGVPADSREAPAEVRAVLFDFEGTLVEFAWDLDAGEAALRDGLADMGFPRDLFAADSYATMWNRALRLDGAAAGEDELRARLGPVYDRFDLDALDRWRLRPGALETVAELDCRGLLVAVVSNIGRIALEPAIERFGLAAHLDLVLTRDDVRFMKPDGEGLRRCLERLGVVAAQALFVGDSRTDVLAARDAGVRVAIVTGGESAPEAYENLQPDAFLGGLSEVMGIDRRAHG
jgi:HAD superfamily hydrolase (TIGR01509 family)